MSGVLSYCDDRQGWYPKEDVQRRKAVKRFREIEHAVSDLPFPMIVSDQLEMKSMINGEIFTSKAAYYKHVRANNCEIVGNEDITGKYRATPSAADDIAHTKDIESDVKTAIEQLEAKL